jgi:hypothetical protein
MTLMLVLAAIAVLFVPSVQDGDKAAAGARQVTSMLHIAKSRAMRDRAPRGVRLLYTTDPNQITQLQYIEQPTDFYDPKSAVSLCARDPRLLQFSGIDLWGGAGPGGQPNWPVQKGDYIEINGSGQVWRIQQDPASSGSPPGVGDLLFVGMVNTSGRLTSRPGTSPATINIPSMPNVLPGMSLTLGTGATQETVMVISHPTGSPVYTVSTCNQAPPPAPDFMVRNDPPLYCPTFPSGFPYRIMRSPRVVAGEDGLTLPVDVAIQLGAATGATAYDPPVSSPSSSIGVAALPGQVWHDIMFSPSGAIVGSGAANDKIILWVRDVTQPNVTDNSPILVCVYTRSGLIAAHPVDVSGPSPYSFTVDGKSSGE